MSIIGLKTKNGVIYDGLSFDDTEIVESINQIRENLQQKAQKTYPNITLPIPYDENNDTLTLIIDIGIDGTFEIQKTDSNSQDLVQGQYCRISMANQTHRSRMKIFQTDHFVQIPQNGIGTIYYDSNIVLTLDKTIFPYLEYDKTYYARYTWADSNESYTDWKGFILKNDVQDFAHPQLRIQ